MTHSPWRGQVALVSGAGSESGIGIAIARRLGQAGVRVILTASSARIQQRVAELQSEGIDACGQPADLTDESQVIALAEWALARHGRIDFLVNCLGTQQIEPLVDVTEDAFDRVMDVNLKAAMFLAQAVARVQIATRSGGRHVHLLSVRAALGMRDRGYSSYCSSKGGLAMLVRQHAVELAREGINVNGVAPTVVKTRMASDWSDPELHRRLLERIPLGRVAEVEDVSGPVLFFLGPASAFVTGQILYVDGGITATQ